jgi:hypothetical protein
VRGGGCVYDLLIRLQLNNRYMLILSKSLKHVTDYKYVFMKSIINLILGPAKLDVKVFRVKKFSLTVLCLNLSRVSLFPNKVCRKNILLLNLPLEAIQPCDYNFLPPLVSS